LFAYGPVPGIELIPYFLGLVGWLGLAIVAVFWAPIAALWRRLRGNRSGAAPAPTAPTPTASTATASEPEAGDHDRMPPSRQAQG
jgi:hypothetical protein